MKPAYVRCLGKSPNWQFHVIWEDGQASRIVVAKDLQSWKCLGTFGVMDEVLREMLKAELIRYQAHQ